MELKSIEQEWQGFSEMVFAYMRPATNQVAEMKKAFFAGAWAMFNSVSEIGEDHVSLSAAAAYLEARRDECLEFKRALIKEYAETKLT